MSHRRWEPKQLEKRTVYLIDGVSVPKLIYDRRQIFGEHREASFRVVEVSRERR